MKLFEKFFNINEAIDDYLNNLDDSTDDSDNKDNRNFQSSKIFFQPPVNANNENSDVESGDEH